MTFFHTKNIEYFVIETVPGLCPIFAMPLRLRANPTVLNQIWFVSNFVFHFHTHIHSYNQENLFSTAKMLFNFSNTNAL